MRQAQDGIHGSAPTRTNDRGGAPEGQLHQAQEGDCVSMKTNTVHRGGAPEDELHEAQDGDLLAQRALVRDQRWLRVERGRVARTDGVVRVQVAVVERGQHLGKPLVRRPVQHLDLPQRDSGPSIQAPSRVFTQFGSPPGFPESLRSPFTSGWA
jgi:hypothetical protein